MSNLYNSLKTKIHNWWAKDVLSINDPSPDRRVFLSIIEFTTAIGIMVFLDKGSDVFDMLPGENINQE